MDPITPTASRTVVYTGRVLAFHVKLLLRFGEGEGFRVCNMFDANEGWGEALKRLVTSFSPLPGDCKSSSVSGGTPVSAHHAQEKNFFLSDLLLLMA